MRILLVEDHEDTRTSLISLLQTWGHTVLAAANVAEALTLLVHARIDALICDLGLPDGDGLNVVAQTKVMNPYIKAIALTARGSDDDHKVGFESGVDHYLVKPPDFRQLRALLS